MKLLRAIADLGIHLLPRLPLGFHLFVRLLQTSAKEVHLRLATLQLQDQLALCGPAKTLSKLDTVHTGGKCIQNKVS